MADEQCDQIDILIPGLLGPVPIAPDDVPATPVLSRLLGRADRVGRGEDDPLGALLGRFGVRPRPGGDWPSAPFCWLADMGGADPAACLMHADPVHLRADRDRLLLFDARHLGITAQEAGTLVETFNAHFAEDGLRLRAPVPDRWYLELPRLPGIRTSPLHAVTGRGIEDLLPAGEEAATWARLLNEVQMLFHHSEVNRRREAAGRPTVNGIWAWGGGRLGALPPSRDYRWVYAGHPLAQGLAAAAGIGAGPLPTDGGSLLGQGGSGSRLVLWDCLWPAVLDADAAGWAEGLRQLDAWLAPLNEGLARAGGTGIVLDPCTGERYLVSRRTLRRFWRRPLALVPKPRRERAAETARFNGHGP